MQNERKMRNRALQIGLFATTLLMVSIFACTNKDDNYNYNHIVFEDSYTLIESSLLSISALMTEKKLTNVYVSINNEIVINNTNCGKLTIIDNDKKFPERCNQLFHMNNAELNNLIFSIKVLIRNGISSAYRRYNTSVLVFPYREYSSNNDSYRDTREIVFKDEIDTAYLKNHRVIDQYEKLLLVTIK